MKNKFLFSLSLIVSIFTCFGQQTELITNPDFLQGTSNWWYTGAEVSVANGEVTFNISNPGSNSWDIQLGQGGLTLRKGYKYTLKWRAKRTSGTIDFRVQLNSSPYTYIFGKNENQDGSWKETSVVYEQTGTDIQDVGLAIHMGGSTAQAVFDYISLKEELIVSENPNPELEESNPGTGPVSYYGQMEARGNRVYSKRLGKPMQVKGMSFYWSIWGGEEFWTSGAVKALVDDWKVEVIRVPMAVEFNDDWRKKYGYLDPRGRDYQVKLVEKLVDAAIENDIYVIIDYHSHDAHLHTQNAKEFFGYMAKKYGKYDNVVFEIYNEPIDPNWATIKTYANAVIDTIRTYSDNLVTVGTEFFSLKPDISSLSPIDDLNVAYVFHFYGRNMETFGANVTTALNNNAALFATEWGTIYMDEGDLRDKTDAASFANSNAYHELMDANMISSANWCVLSTNMTSETPNEACLFNEQFGAISRTGENWDDTTKMTPSGKYVYKWLNEQAQTVKWRKVIHEPLAKHFSKGVNLVDWFHRADNVGRIQFTKYSKQDFVNLKAMGCDVIRFPIQMKAMTNGAPQYILDPRLFYFLDQVIDWAEEVKINLILDYHIYDASFPTPANADEELIPIWKQIASRYKDRSEYIFYEIQNEPHDIADATWNNIQKQVITAIRAIDNVHTIIVSPAGWSSCENFSLMPVYDDKNLIYTFHFYDPHIFTGQGTTDSDFKNLTGVPFPYVSNRMPALPDALRGSYVETQYNNYPTEGTVAHVRELLDKAVAFRNERNVEVYCGEFGVNMFGSPNNDRIFWHQTVRTYLEENNIPWTIWAYQSGFGIFKEGSNELRDHDMNVALAQTLGFTVPSQSELVAEPEKQPFTIYTDYMSPQVSDVSWGNDALLDFHSDTDPKDGKFCLYWSEAGQYSRIGFDFVPDKDLSVLAQQNYQLSLYVKGNVAGTSFDIRFADTDTSEPDDYGWRMRYTIDDSKVTWDGKWHKLLIPLKTFGEYGVYDNGWHEPNGRFDWSAIDLFEIVTESQSLKNKKLWFDQIEIVAPAVVNYTVSAPVNPVNTGSVTGTGTYENGKQATLTAIPNSGFEFVNWTIGGSEVSINNTYSIKVTADVTVQANFRLITSASQIKSSDSVHIFPNPTNQIINIIGLPSAQTNLVAHIHGYDGRLVLTKELNDPKESTVDISILKNGIYYLTISGDKFISTQKIIKHSDK